MKNSKSKMFQIQVEDNEQIHIYIKIIIPIVCPSSVLSQSVIPPSNNTLNVFRLHTKLTASSKQNKT